MRSRYLLLIVLVLLLAACQAPAPPPDTSAADKAVIGDATPAWAERFNAGDAAGIAALYAPGAILYPPNAGPLTGRQAIQEFWQGVLDTGIKGELTLEEVGVDGDLGFKTGTYRLTSPEGALVDEGHWLEVWTRTSEGWFSSRDIWNSDLPLASE